MRLKEDVHSVPVCDALLAALEMLYPVAARILQLRRQAAGHHLLFYLASQSAGIREATHVLPKAIGRGHELEAARRQLLVCADLIYPEVDITAPIFVEEEVAKRRMV
jgi:hypothetical protein